jgi:hypothetical protein
LCRSRVPPPLRAPLSLAQHVVHGAIAAGELDDHLGALAAAVEARRRLLLTVRSATALATLCVGDVVRITEKVSPRYILYQGSGLAFRGPGWAAFDRSTAELVECIRSRDLEP